MLVFISGSVQHALNSSCLFILSAQTNFGSKGSPAGLSCSSVENHSALCFFRRLVFWKDTDKLRWFLLSHPAAMAKLPQRSQHWLSSLSRQKMCSFQILPNPFSSPCPGNIDASCMNKHKKTGHLLNLLLISVNKLPVISANVSAFVNLCFPP